MIKTPIEELIESSITRFSTSNLCESAKVCDLLLDILQLMKKGDKNEGLTKMKILEQATPSILETV